MVTRRWWRRGDAPVPGAAAPEVVVWEVAEDVVVRCPADFVAWAVRSGLVEVFEAEWRRRPKARDRQQLFLSLAEQHGAPPDLIADLHAFAAR